MKTAADDDGNDMKIAANDNNDNMKAANEEDDDSIIMKATADDDKDVLLKATTNNDNNVLLKAAIDNNDDVLLRTLHENNDVMMNDAVTYAAPAKVNLKADNDDDPMLKAAILYFQEYNFDTNFVFAAASHTNHATAATMDTATNMSRTDAPTTPATFTDDKATRLDAAAPANKEDDKIIMKNKDDDGCQDGHEEQRGNYCHLASAAKATRLCFCHCSRCYNGHDEAHCHSRHQYPPPDECHSVFRCRQR